MKTVKGVWTILRWIVGSVILLYAVTGLIFALGFWISPSVVQSGPSLTVGDYRFDCTTPVGILVNVGLLAFLLFWGLDWVPTRSANR